MRRRKRNKIVRSLIRCVEGYEPAIVSINEFVDLIGDMDKYEFDCVKQLVLDCVCAGMDICTSKLEKVE